MPDGVDEAGGVGGVGRVGGVSGVGEVGEVQATGPGRDDRGREYDVRPWGSFTVLDDAELTHKVKRLVVRPGKRLSYQRHARRAEHWFILSGQALITLDGKPVEVGPGQSVDVLTGVAHRIENIGPDDVVFIEVQHGDYFGEDDITRLEDDFGRVGEADADAGPVPS